MLSKSTPCTPYRYSCDVMLCDVIPCRNGGSCSRGVCYCPTGFSGVYCEQVKGHCVSQPCVNDGVCIQDGGTYTCVCRADFRGRHCQHQKLRGRDGGILPVTDRDDPICTSTKYNVCGLNPITFVIFFFR